MPKLSISVTDADYEYLKLVDASPTQAIRKVIAFSAQMAGYVYQPAGWRKVDEAHE